MNERLAKLFEQAIDTLQKYEPPEGYFVAFSGGKDSIVIYDLVKRSGCKHEAHFSKTSIDPPELLAFVKEHYPEVVWHRPELTMFQLIEKMHMMPTPRHRYCCRYLKEREGSGRMVVTGVRKAESRKRSKWNMFEISHTDKTKKFIHIIIDWTDNDVWDYIKTLGMPYCCLYDQGHDRVGCILCPLKSAKKRQADAVRFPNHKKAYINAIGNSLKIKPSKYFGQDAELFFEWWISNKTVSRFFGEREQIDVFENNLLS